MTEDTQADLPPTDNKTLLAARAVDDAEQNAAANDQDVMMERLRGVAGSGGVASQRVATVRPPAPSAQADETKRLAVEQLEAAVINTIVLCKNQLGGGQQFTGRDMRVFHTMNAALATVRPVERFVAPEDVLNTEIQPPLSRTEIASIVVGDGVVES